MVVESPRGVRHRYGVDESVSFEIVDSKGAVRFVVSPSKRDCNQKTVTWCHTLLEEIDPVPSLSLVRGSGQ